MDYNSILLEQDQDFREQRDEEKEAWLAGDSDPIEATQGAYEKGWQLASAILEEKDSEEILEDLLGTETIAEMADGVLKVLRHAPVSLPWASNLTWTLGLKYPPSEDINMNVLESFKEGLFEGYQALEDEGEF